MDNCESNCPSGVPMGLTSNKYVPPKDWNDITSDEKIERMREIIKSLQNNIGRTQTDIHHIKRNFAQHTHGDKGINVPYNEYYGNELGACLVNDSRKNYF